MSRRVSVNFSERAMATLQRLAEKKGVTISEVLRSAIALEDMVTDETLSGSKILIEKNDGRVREIVTR